MLTGKNWKVACIYDTVEPRYSEDPVITNNTWKPGRITELPRYNEFFVLSLSVSKNDMMIQMADKPNTTRIGQDRKTLTFEALLYLNVAVHAQVYRLFWGVYIPLFSLVQLNYPAITNIFVVNQIIRYNTVFAITKTPL